MSNFERFTISQSGILIREGKAIILEDAKHPGYWLFPGGRIDKGELWEVALRREILEELGLTSFDILGIVDFDIWYTASGNAISGIVRLIKNDKDPIALSPEHLQYRWVHPDEVSLVDFVWPNARRLLANAFEMQRKLENEK